MSKYKKFDLRLLTAGSRLVFNPRSETESKTDFISEAEYKRLITGQSQGQRYSSDVREIREALRRLSTLDSSLLINCIFSFIGALIFAWYALSFLTIEMVN